MVITPYDPWDPRNLAVQAAIDAAENETWFAHRQRLQAEGDAADLRRQLVEERDRPTMIVQGVPLAEYETAVRAWHANAELARSTQAALSALQAQYDDLAAMSGTDSVWYGLAWTVRGFRIFDTPFDLETIAVA